MRIGTGSAALVCIAVLAACNCWSGSARAQESCANLQYQLQILRGSGGGGSQWEAFAIQRMHELGCFGPRCPGNTVECGNACCNEGFYCSKYGCTPHGAVDCGTGYCNPGQKCSRGGSCIPEDRVDCGTFNCPEGTTCARGHRACLAADDTDCNGYHCGAGKKCASGRSCIPEDNVDCGINSKISCRPGSKCSRDGKRCLDQDAVDCGSYSCRSGSKCGSKSSCLSKDAVDCGNGKSCEAGYLCVRGGTACQTPQQIAEERAAEKRRKEEETARKKREAEERKAAEARRIAEQREAARQKDEQQKLASILKGQKVAASRTETVAVVPIRPKPITVSIAREVQPYSVLASDVYADQTKPNSSLYGFHRIGDDWRTTMSKNGIGAAQISELGRSNFYAATYVNAERKEIVIAYRGSLTPAPSGASLKDWATNIGARFLPSDGKIRPTQYEAALEYAKSVQAVVQQREYKDFKIKLTGHSEGGGEASYVASQLGLDTYTFNPARNAFSTDGGPARPSRQVNVNTINDFVGDPDISRRVGKGLLPGETVFVGATGGADLPIGQRHSMDNVAAGLGEFVLRAERTKAR